jgi:hypothetical protein
MRNLWKLLPPAHYRFLRQLSASSSGMLLRALRGVLESCGCAEGHRLRRFNHDAAPRPLRPNQFSTPARSKPVRKGQSHQTFRGQNHNEPFQQATLRFAPLSISDRGGPLRTSQLDLLCGDRPGDPIPGEPCRKPNPHSSVRRRLRLASSTPDAQIGRCRLPSKTPRYLPDRHVSAQSLRYRR